MPSKHCVFRNDITNLQNITNIYKYFNGNNLRVIHYIFTKFGLVVFICIFAYS